jgi:uncharacterized protein (DUF1499 family)
VHTSRFAQLAIVVACVSAALFVGAPLLVMLGALKSLVGFPLFMLGGLLGLLALLLGLVSLYTTRPATGRAGRGLALVAALIGVSVLGATALAARPGLGAPPINDITTDPDDPPQFDALLREGPNAGRDMSYPGAEFATAQRAGYPDLAPISVATTASDTFAAATRAMEGFGWKIVREDPTNGLIEATDTSRVFRFVDDIAVRIRPQATGSRVDVRSKSREGRGDLGANAARIRRLRDALR